MRSTMDGFILVAIVVMSVTMTTGVMGCSSCPHDCLIAYYPFENDETDSSGHNHHGAVVNSVTYEAGKCGQAVRFNGESKVDVDSLRNFAWGESFTVMVWLQRTGSFGTYQGVVNNGYYSTGSWEIRMGRELNGEMIGGGIITTPGGVTWDFVNLQATKNVWHHVAMTYDGQALRYFLDGVQQAAATSCCTGPILAKDTPVTIGQAGPGHTNEFFVGLIDEVKIYGRALSAAEVQNMAIHPCL